MTQTTFDDNFGLGQLNKTDAIWLVHQIIDELQPDEIHIIYHASDDYYEASVRVDGVTMFWGWTPEYANLYLGGIESVGGEVTEFIDTFKEVLDETDV